MTVKSVKRYFSLALILGLTSAALAQPYSETWEESNTAPMAQVSSEYTLGWQDTHKEIAVKESAPAVEAPVAVNLAELPGLISAAGGAVSLESGMEIASAGIVTSRRARSLRGPSSVSVPTHDITLRADRYFDHYTDNYRYVNRVEVVTYRGDFPRTEVYENPAQYSTYDVYINDLKVGDRYEVRVTWDDGTFRIIDRSIGRHPEYNVRVSTPG
jgi:hypothetical protein